MDLRFGTRMDLQKAPGHRTDPVTRFVLLHPSPGQAQQYRTPPVASQPLSSPLVVVSPEESVELPASCCPRSLPVTVPCTSSECLHCDISRTAWKHLCRPLAAGLFHVVSHGGRKCGGSLTFLATCILSARNLYLHRDLLICHTWMLILKLAEVVHVFIDDDPEAVRLVVGGNVGFRESLRHVLRRSSSTGSITEDGT